MPDYNRLETGPEALQVGSLVVYPGAQEATLAGRTIDCTPTEFAILEVLAEQPGRVFSRRQLIARLREGPDFRAERTIDTHIANLRRKLRGPDGATSPVVTVYGVGYKLAVVRSAAVQHGAARPRPPM